LSWDGLADRCPPPSVFPDKNILETCEILPAIRSNRSDSGPMVGKDRKRKKRERFVLDAPHAFFSGSTALNRAVQPTFPVTVPDDWYWKFVFKSTYVTVIWSV